MLAPYVEMTFFKHLRDAEHYGIEHYNDYVYAIEKTEKDVYDAFQSYEYEVNTLHTANGQTRLLPSLSVLVQATTNA
ncbi:anaerobic ribonucleotide reductase subunit [Klebsiella phage CPRSB]|nr:anaerobic ribonucleotide reductase subunit [Klebsiella phage CPRSB]